MDGRGMVIVGAGECGTRAAFAPREEGYAGPITLVGAERHLPYERPPLSKAALAPEPEGMKAIAEAERFAAADIRLLLQTQVVSIERESRLVELGDGSRLTYGRLLLATGARPRRLPLAEGSRHCVYLRARDDAEKIAERLRPEARVVIIGGGFIGLELAAAARRRGCAVRVLEALPRLLARAVPEEIAAVMTAAHRQNGVDIRCDVSLASIEDDGGGVRVSLQDGSEIAADLCIIGVGAIPNTELAERAGLPVENGIRVDETLATDDPSIFAAGDCCSFPLEIYGAARCGWRPGATRRTRARWRHATCLAGLRRMRQCRGSGRISTT
jgi:3-phenylpropionate/trans-cinnamate dioxygenase ferredoxin reductase subunit